MANLDDMKRRAIATVREEAAQAADREVCYSGGLMPDADRIYARRRKAREITATEEVQ